jgi:hypothetical protein
MKVKNDLVLLAAISLASGGSVPALEVWMALLTLALAAVVMPQSAISAAPNQSLFGWSTPVVAYIGEEVYSGQMTDKRGGEVVVQSTTVGGHRCSGHIDLRAKAFQAACTDGVVGHGEFINLGNLTGYGSLVFPNGLMRFVYGNLGSSAIATNLRPPSGTTIDTSGKVPVLVPVDDSPAERVARLSSVRSCTTAAVDQQQQCLVDLLNTSDNKFLEFCDSNIGRQFGQKAGERCKAERIAETKSMRDHDVEYAKVSLALAIQDRDLYATSGARVRACATTTGADLAKSSATLTEIAQVATARCRDALDSAARLDAFRGDAQAQEKLEERFRQDVMSAALAIRSSH